MAWTVPPAREGPVRLVVLVSGTGSNLQELLDASRDPGYGARVAAAGSDRDAIPGLDRARHAGVATFVVRATDFADRAAWDRALTEAVAAHQPDLVILAGFMKIVGSVFLERFEHRVINTHPALLPSFPGTHGVRDALAYGAKITGCTIHLVAAEVDSGPPIAQAPVPVLAGDDEQSLHERIKSVERALLVETVGRLAREGYRVEGRRVQIGI
ncbi:MAG: phosphoribosylglycinamide formyltransferase [Streptomycetales bacterium]